MHKSKMLKFYNCHTPPEVSDQAWYRLEAFPNPFTGSREHQPQSCVQSPASMRLN